ncbi:MAG TPA: hypothetical protein VFW94_23590 [Candidatus Acidoferrales bacterium]|nr:hypothetical protein [Candidatus Acidoferrales bacterium]
MEITNVKVVDYGEQHPNVALQWQSDGFRFHVWENEPNVLFKNPPLDVARNNHRYFHTRRLDARSKTNAAMIALARQIATRLGLYEKAVQEKQEEAESQERKRQAAIALNRKREAAEDLYATLITALAALESGPNYAPRREAIAQVRGALTRAGWIPAPPSPLTLAGTPRLMDAAPEPLHDHERATDKLEIHTSAGTECAVNRGERSGRLFAAWDAWVKEQRGCSAEAHHWNAVLEAAYDYLNEETPFTLDDDEIADVRAL